MGLHLSRSKTRTNLTRRRNDSVTAGEDEDTKLSGGREASAVPCETVNSSDVCRQRRDEFMNRLNPKTLLALVSRVAREHRTCAGCGVRKSDTADGELYGLQHIESRRPIIRIWPSARSDREGPARRLRAVLPPMSTRSALLTARSGGHAVSRDRCEAGGCGIGIEEG